MKHIDIGTSTERIQCRVRIEGSFNGENFTYEDSLDDDGSQYIWVETNDPSTFWWTEGNMACDCNRWQYLPEHLQQIHNGECGHEIVLNRIIPIEGENLPILDFEECENEP